MAKQIIFNKQARQKLQQGVDILANTVKKTMGPKGKVAIFRRGEVIFSLDGVTVANQIELKDEVEAMGCDLVKEIAKKTDKEAGDGTTTAILLSQIILQEGLKAIAAGIDTIKIKKGIKQGLSIAVETIKKLSKPIKNKQDIVNIGTISSRDREIGETIADIIDKVGKEAIIAVETSNIIGLHKEIVEGLQFEKGFISPYFITHPENNEAILEKPYVLVTTQTISTNQEVIRLLEELFKSENKSLLVVSENTSGEALATFVINKMRGALKIVAVQAPGFGDDKTEKLQDIAVLTGAQFISEEVGKKVEDIELQDLGGADRVIVGKDKCLIIGGQGKKSEIKKRITLLQGLIKKEESEYYKEIMKKRLAKLQGGVAVIKVGTISEQENKEKRFRIEDAVMAVKSAIDEGIVPGAGMALIQASREIDKHLNKEKDIAVRMGLQILSEAIQEPAKQIIRNAGGKPDVILEKVKDDLSRGYNSDTGEYVNLLEAGIVDPVKVVRVALENAVSVVSLLLITESVISELPKEDGKE